MLKRFASLIILLLAPSLVSAQWWSLSTPGIPRTVDGEPDLLAPVPMATDGHTDLSGLWISVGASGSLYEPENIQEWARQVMIENENNFYANDPRFACLPSGPGSYPAGVVASGLRRFVQNPTFIAVLNSDYTYRQIFMDGRELEVNPFPAWMGYSIAHWEGDTLVVESNGFNDKTWLHRDGLPHTDQLIITERYRRVDFGHIELEVTYEDPGTFTEPVQAFIELEFRADTELFENVCNESSRGLSSNWSGEIQQADDNVVDVSMGNLETYIGTYQGIWLGTLTTAEFAIENGEMYLIRTPGYSDTGGNTDSVRSRLVPLSENAFDCICGLGFVFSVNEEGMATEVSEVHVSGAWSFERVN
ncbi:MAG: hypothetical protein P8J61_09225 [Gammaproteobacteria bacterium]|jgi:hypothetical protein|nr:hypothetical protein [Gammaproteobacteria bacterium]